MNFTNFGEHFSEVSWHVQRGSSKFKALGELSLAIRLSIYWISMTLLALNSPNVMPSCKALNSPNVMPSCKALYSNRPDWMKLLTYSTLNFSSWVSPKTGLFLPQAHHCVQVSCYSRKNIHDVTQCPGQRDVWSRVL